MSLASKSENALGGLKPKKHVVKNLVFTFFGSKSTLLFVNWPYCTLVSRLRGLSDPREPVPGPAEKFHNIPQIGGPQPISGR